MHTTHALPVFVGAALAALSACATLGTTRSDTATDLEIRVSNDLNAFAPVSISLVDDQGNRESLGEVDSGETRSFDATGEVQTGVRYRLMAEPNGGETILSPEIVIREGSIVVWNLRDNRVQLFEARERPGG